MKTCPKCAEQVQDDAKACRFCGASLTTGSNRTLLIVAGVATALVLFASVGPNSQPDGPSDIAAQGRNTIKATSDELVAAYEANEAAAQAKYGSSTLVVTGPVQRIDLDITDKPLIVLSKEAFSQSVTANLVEADQPKAVNLVKGQIVSVTCQGISEVLGSPILKDCSL